MCSIGKLCVALTVFCIISAKPLETESHVFPLNFYTPAVDFSAHVPVNQLSCLKLSGYFILFLRGFSAENDGEFDPNAIINFHNALKYSFGLQIYMEPQPASKTKNATQQLDEMMGSLTHYGLYFRFFWLQVSSKTLSKRNSDAVFNVAFIDAIISRAQVLGPDKFLHSLKLQQGGIGVGIYTNQDEWKQITNNWTPNYPNIPLWYSSVKGNGTQEKLRKISKISSLLDLSQLPPPNNTE